MIEPIIVFAQYGIAGLAIYVMYRIFISQQKNIARGINEGFDKVVNKLDELKLFMLTKDPKGGEKE